MMSNRSLRLPLLVGSTVFNYHRGPERVPDYRTDHRIDHQQLEEQYALSQVCSEQHLSEIACKLENWETLCAYLSINGAEQAELKKNHQGDYRSQKIQALKLWKRKFGRIATYETLVGIFEKLGYIEFAEDITDLALESSKTPSAHSQGRSSHPFHVKPDINDLMNLVPLIAPKWSLLGIKLNFPEYLLTQISKCGSDMQCTITMLKLWLGHANHANWDELLKVLELPFMGLADVAEKLKVQLSARTTVGIDSVTSSLPIKLTDPGKKYTCLMIDLIELLPPDSWKKMRMALEHYVDPSSGLYPGEVDPAVYKDVKSVSNMLSSLKKFQLLTPVELGWLKFLVDDIVRCPEASQRIKQYEESTDSNPLLGNVHFASGQRPTESTALLSCRADIQPETATCGNVRLAKAGCTSYVGIDKQEAVLQSVSVGSISFYWRIPYLKAMTLRLSKSVSLEIKRALDRARITHISVMVDNRCDSISVEELTIAVDHEIDQKTLLNSPVTKVKRKLSDSRKYWLALRRKDTTLSYQVEFYPNRQSASRGKDILQVLSFSDITEVRPSRNQKHTVEVLCSSIGYSIGVNCDTEAEKLLKDLQRLHSSHHNLYRYAISKSERSSVGKLLQVDGRCVSPDSLVHLKFYDSVFGHLQEKPPELLNCVIKCTLSQVPIAKMSAEPSPVARKRSSTKSTPCSPFAVRSLDLSLEQQSSLKIGESSESQRRTQTFSATVRSKILNFSPRTHTNCCHAK